MAITDSCRQRLCQSRPHPGHRAGAGKAAARPGGADLRRAAEGGARQRQRTRAQIRCPDAGMAAGKANVMDVVTAVAETEVAVDALVSVRDRVIQAYEEIMKMPI